MNRKFPKNFVPNVVVVDYYFACFRLEFWLHPPDSMSNRVTVKSSKTIHSSPTQEADSSSSSLSTFTTSSSSATTTTQHFQPIPSIFNWICVNAFAMAPISYLSCLIPFCVVVRCLGSWVRLRRLSGRGWILLMPTSLDWLRYYLASDFDWEGKSRWS